MDRHSKDMLAYLTDCSHTVYLPTSAKRTAKSAQRHYVADLLPAIHTPALLIWGDNDKITPPHVAREFEQYLPNATLVMLKQCGHAPMMERPVEFNGVLEGWLGE